MNNVSSDGSPANTGGPSRGRRHTRLAVACLAAASLALGTGITMTIASTRSPAAADSAPVDKGQIGADLSALLPIAGFGPAAHGSGTGSGAAPVAIRIASIGVDAAIVGLRLDRQHRLPAPGADSTVGWWRDGAAPGETGIAILDGHLDNVRGPAVFAKLRSIDPGARVDVRRADGTTAVFVVDGIREFRKSKVPTRWVYGATSRPTLRLITCGGVFDRRTGHYLDNVVVFAHLLAVRTPA